MNIIANMHLHEDLNMQANMHKDHKARFAAVSTIAPHEIAFVRLHHPLGDVERTSNLHNLLQKTMADHPLRQVSYGSFTPL